MSHRADGQVDGDFRLLFEESPDVLLVLLPDAPRYTMVAATRARLAATLLTREQTIGRGLFEVFPDNPADADATGTSNLRASLDRVLATRAADTMAVQKYDIRRPDGSFQVKYWSPKNLPVLGAKGEVLYILHRVEDVTDLVRADEVGQELRDRTREMEREVITRSRELAEANRDLRDANAKLGELDAAKTAFFSNVSHEFRTPLTLILGPIEDALAGPDRVLAGEALVAVHRSVGRLMRLVNSLLDFSRIEAGRLQLCFAPTDLATLTAGLAGSFRSLLDGAQLKLEVSCPRLPEAVYVDRAHWEKIVLNLLSNAYKFTFQGGIAVRLRWCGDHVELEVADTGSGIPEGELSRIFERFHRVAGARSRSFEGSGIGLALVHELTRLHGGSIRVDSKVGEGSRFIVSIPTGTAHLAPELVASGPDEQHASSSLAQSVVDEAHQWDATTNAAAEPRRTHEPAPAEPGAARGRVLVVDDNLDMREYLARLLRPQLDVQLARNGVEALAAAVADPPDLILSDMMMPELDGIGLLRALRARDETRMVPFVLLSARAGDEAVVSGLETGADDYLVKPFSARELMTRVKTHLEMARIRRAATEAATALAETRAALLDGLEQKNQALAKAYGDLQATQAQLIQSAKMASLGQLVAGVAHEINNPLAFAISHLATACSCLREVEASGAVAAVQESPHWQKAVTRLHEMEHGLHRIQELVIRLRTFSRLDEGERKQASMSETIASVLTILQHRLGERITVTTTVSEPDLVDCYPGLLTQAIMNLVANAIEAIEGRGAVGITVGAQGGDYCITVTDTGNGIPADIRDRVVEPFFTTKAIGEGTGLGLSITYSIAHKHGGELQLLPAEGGGTAARIRFPLGCP